jgi:hypothetical protein
MTNDGEAPVVLGESEVMDEVRNSKGSSVESLQSSFSSWNAEEKPLEELRRRGPQGGDGCVDLRCICSKGRHQQDLQSEGERTRPERGLGIPGLCRNRRFSAAGLSFSGEEFRRPGGVSSENRKGSRGRR